MIQSSSGADRSLLHSLIYHAAFRYPIPDIAQIRRLAWSVAHFRQSSALDIALAENNIFLADYIDQQNEVIRDLRMQVSERTSLAHRERGT